MKAKVLIIIIVVIVSGIFISLAYNQEIKLISGIQTDTKPSDINSGRITGEDYCGDWCNQQEFEDLGCNQLLLAHINRDTNLLDENFDETYVHNFIGLPDGVSEEQFEKCVDIILEKRNREEKLPENQPVNFDKITIMEPNSKGFFYYPNPQDTENRDVFQKFILIRLPESMGGGVDDVSAFRAYSMVSLSTDHCLVNYWSDPGRQNMQNPCWGGTYRAIDGLLTDNVDPIMITSPVALPYLDLSIDEYGALYVEPPEWNLQENGVISIGRQISMQEIHQGSQVLIDSYEKSHPYHPMLPLEFAGHVLAEIHVGDSIEVRYFNFSSMSGYIYFDVDNVSAQDQQYFQNFVKSGAEYWQIEDVVVRIDGSAIEDKNPKQYKHYKIEFIKDGFKFTIEGNELEFIKRNIISNYFPENEFDDLISRNSK